MDFEDSDYWKAIVLYGLNNATYKMALASVLLESAKNGEVRLEWIDLCGRYLDSYIKRLSDGSSPQQANPSRRTLMERIVTELKAQRISYDEAIGRVADEGFEDVIPRFHTIGRDPFLARSKFYDFEKGKYLTLKDSLLALNSKDELLDEVRSRWSLLEGAFTIQQSNFQLANNVREVYLANGYRRTSLTPLVPFLQGYQANICFYCGEAILNDIHVDHVLPRQLMNHDEVWNLVLVHAECNLSKLDKLVGTHFIEKLIARNENIMGSNHPWKSKISSSLGDTKRKRVTNLRKHYENTKAALGQVYWGGSSDYNPSRDQFFKRLITVLNNK